MKRLSRSSAYIRQKTADLYDDAQSKMKDGGKEMTILRGLSFKQDTEHFTLGGHADDGHAAADPGRIPVFHPSSRLRRWWVIGTTAWVIYCVAVVPFEAGFTWWHAPISMKYWSYFLDAWFWCDILANFNTGFIHHGLLVMDRKEIAVHYLESWFLIDLAGSIPFEMIYADSYRKGKLRKWSKVLKYAKIPKLLRVFRCFKFLQRYRELYQSALSFLFLIIAMHVSACMWVLTLNPCEGFDSHHGGHGDDHGSGHGDDHGDDHADDGHRFLTSSGNYSSSAYASYGESAYGAAYDDASLDDFDLAAACDPHSASDIYVEALHLSVAMLLGISNAHIVADTSILALQIRSTVSASTAFVLSSIYEFLGFLLVSHFLANLITLTIARNEAGSDFIRTMNRITSEMELYAIPHHLREQVRHCHARPRNKLLEY